MKQEDKDLLLKDLSARLPYNVKCQIDYDNEEDAYLGIERYCDDRIVSVCIETEEIGLYEASEYFYPDEIKPYLFPLSSMTEEQKKQLKQHTCPDGTGYFDGYSLCCPVNHFGENIPFEFMAKIMDWLNKNHFDYRGLIEKGLSIDCTNLNIY